MSSLNKYMHPRNRYGSYLNFKELLQTYPQISKYCTIDLAGKIKFDFNDRGAISCLTQVLLKRDFGLDINIPSDSLIPTLGLRVNYILWIEDIFEDAEEEKRQLSGIDIGTGATCIFPVLMAKLNGWRLLATESNKKNVETASRNVNTNNLQHLITVKEVSKTTYLVGAINESERYDFCICNPPFYSKKEELDPNYRARNERTPPRCHNTGKLDEVVVEGGEVEFVKGIISDSVILRDKIRVYTVMLGHKKSVKMLLQELKKAKVTAIAEAEFCQGRTVRWGLSWSFCMPKIRSFKLLSQTEKMKPIKPIKWIIHTRHNVEDCSRIIQDNLIEIKVDVRQAQNVDEGVFRSWNLTAYENTWSKQRQKRRAAMFQNTAQEQCGTSSDAGVSINVVGDITPEPESSPNGNSDIKTNESELTPDYTEENIDNIREKSEDRCGEIHIIPNGSSSDKYPTNSDDQSNPSVDEIQDHAGDSARLDYCSDTHQIFTHCDKIEPDVRNSGTDKSTQDDDCDDTPIVKKIKLCDYESKDDAKRDKNPTEDGESVISIQDVSSNDTGAETSEMDQNSSENKQKNPENSVESNTGTSGAGKAASPLVKARLCLLSKTTDDSVELQIYTLEGSKDSSCQILQFLKNKLVSL